MEGYIITNQGEPLQLCYSFPDAPQAGVLTKGDTVTVFPTRSGARSAIARTLRWAQKECEQHHIPLWEWAKPGLYRVRRATSAV